MDLQAAVFNIKLYAYFDYYYNYYDDFNFFVGTSASYRTNQTGLGPTIGGAWNRRGIDSETSDAQTPIGSSGVGHK